MRWLLGISVTLVILWSGYWFAGKTVIERQAAEILAAETAAGRLAEVGSLQVQGWPNRWDLLARDLAFGDPARGIGYAAPHAQVFAMTWKPWHIILAPADRQTVTLPGQTITLDGAGLQASLRSAPDVALPLVDIRAGGERLTLTSDAGWTYGWGAFAAAVQRVDGAAAPMQAYRIGLQADGIRPDPRLTAALASVSVDGLAPVTLPAVIDRLHLDATVTLTAPIDRNAGASDPRPQGLALSDLSLIWGEMTVTAAGEIAPDDQGFAAGRIGVTVTNWDQLPPLFVASGLIGDRMGPMLTNMLRAIAKDTGDASTITIPLVLRDGHVSFGPLPLAPAPRLVMPPA